MSNLHKTFESLEITPRGFLGNSLGDTVKIPKNLDISFSFFIVFDGVNVKEEMIPLSSDL